MYVSGESGFQLGMEAWLSTVEVSMEQLWDRSMPWNVLEQLCVPRQDLRVKKQQQLEPKNQSSPHLVPHLDAYSDRSKAETRAIQIGIKWNRVKAWR